MFTSNNRRMHLVAHTAHIIPLSFLLNNKPASSPLGKSNMPLRSAFSIHMTEVATAYIWQVERFPPITQKQN